jgi:hypothetical protein
MLEIVLRLASKVLTSDHIALLFPTRRNTMKKVLSSIVAALVALSFAGIVCAAEPMKEAAPAAPAAGEMKKEEKAPAKKAKKAAKKHKKAKAAKKEMKEKPTAPAAPAAPAAK